jgi:hypothetical protein
LGIHNGSPEKSGGYKNINLYEVICGKFIIFTDVLSRHTSIGNSLRYKSHPAEATARNGELTVSIFYTNCPPETEQR